MPGVLRAGQRQQGDCLTPSAWSGSGLPWGGSPSNGLGPILKWRVCLSGRGGEAAAPKGSWAGRREDSCSQLFRIPVCGLWTGRSLVPWVSHLPHCAVFGGFPENWGWESYQVDHLLSFWFLATSTEKFVQHQVDAVQHQTGRHQNHFLSVQTKGTFFSLVFGVQDTPKVLLNQKAKGLDLKNPLSEESERGSVNYSLPVTKWESSSWMLNAGSSFACLPNHIPSNCISSSSHPGS